MTKVIIQDSKLYNTTAIGLWIKSGSINDPIGKEGLHHFLEHIYFKDPKVQQAQYNLDKLGVLYNAFTSHEVTCFLGQVTKEDTNKLMDFLLKIEKGELNITETDLEKEKRVVIEEINYYLSQPLETLKILTIKSILGLDNPYTNTIYGSKEAVNNITLSDVENGINLFHSNKFIVVSGEFEAISDCTANPIVNFNPSKFDHNRNNVRNLLWSTFTGKRDQCYYGTGILVPEVYQDLSQAFLDNFYSKLLHEIREEQGLTYRIHKNLVNTGKGTVLLFLFQTSIGKLEDLKSSVKELWQNYINKKGLQEELSEELKRLRKLNFIKADNPIGEMKKIAYSYIFPKVNKKVIENPFSEWISAQELAESILVGENSEIQEGLYVKV